MFSVYFVFGQHLLFFVAELVRKIKEVAQEKNLGRLFAIIHINGEQRKITTEDLVLVNGFFPPQIGDKLRLEKVILYVFRDDFS